MNDEYEVGGKGNAAELEEAASGGTRKICRMGSCPGSRRRQRRLRKTADVDGEREDGAKLPPPKPPPVAVAAAGRLLRQSLLGFRGFTSLHRLCFMQRRRRDWSGDGGDGGA